MREATSCRVRVGSTSRQSDKKVDWGGLVVRVWCGLAWFGVVRVCGGRSTRSVVVEREAWFGTHRVWSNRRYGLC